MLDKSWALQYERDVIDWRTEWAPESDVRLDEEM